MIVALRCYRDARLILVLTGVRVDIWPLNYHRLVKAIQKKWRTIPKEQYNIVFRDIK